MKSTPPRFYLKPLFLFNIFLYVGTGILQPVMTDQLRMANCLGRKSLLLPTLIRTTGMALVGILSTSADRSALRRLLKNDAEFRRSLLMAAFVDLISGMMLTGGLLLTGGAIFVVLFNSTPAWTALLSKHFLGRSLTMRQTMGVVVVCIGLIVNVLSTSEQLSHLNDEVVEVMMGSAIVLIGCALHAGFFVLSDRSLRGKNTDGATALIAPTLWSSCLGSMETTIMVIYTAISIGVKGFQPEGVSSDACDSQSLTKGIGFKLLVDSLHSATFFLMLKHIGAVGSALLKGIQSVAVVLLSTVLFCPQEEAQCLTRLKSTSVCLVLGGTVLYAASSSPMDIGQGGKRESIAQKNGPPSAEMESLLDI